MTAAHLEDPEGSTKAQTAGGLKVRVQKPALTVQTLAQALGQLYGTC